jgi:hypothetical protein
MLVIKKYPCIPEEVAKVFIKQRTIIRMKFLNEKITLKRKNFMSEDKKTSKKLKTSLLKVILAYISITYISLY